jgi:hypothetical protein
LEIEFCAARCSNQTTSRMHLCVENVRRGDRRLLDL